MPTNLLRTRDKPRAPAAAVARSRPRRLMLKAGRVGVRVELFDTPTADRVWAALPLYSTAETWGSAIHFETPVETGRERNARLLASPGEVYFWVDEDRVIAAFGRTPISKPGEMRLPRPCNVWAKALDDLSTLAVVSPGEKVSMTALESRSP